MLIGNVFLPVFLFLMYSENPVFNVLPRLSIKKILFPGQRVAKIEASRAAAIFFFSIIILSFFGEKKIGQK